uniref:Uncharacterized protein n=1 Tax=Candidatus Kentrum sp. LFY TaxID=2126342 RepID=A0A450V8C6_9GAMM|nr:MAG: hypothetical protein BECKLFY1418A_GA0070994_11336 [Candidatus Kentron sp. LFY]
MKFWVPIAVLSIVFVLVGISRWSQWYATEISMPRYCEDPDKSLALLRAVMSEARPAGDEARRPYLVAAKLLFLVPRDPDEPVPAYLARVRRHLDGHCRR